MVATGMRAARPDRLLRSTRPVQPSTGVPKRHLAKRGWQQARSLCSRRERAHRGRRPADPRDRCRPGSASTAAASRSRPRSSPAPPGSPASSASSASRSPATTSAPSAPINAFEVAFLVPNTVRALVADAALSSAFVPVFSELLEKGERKRAWRVASSLFWLVMLGLGGLTALFIVIAPWVMQHLRLLGRRGRATRASSSRSS